MNFFKKNSMNKHFTHSDWRTMCHNLNAATNRNRAVYWKAKLANKQTKHLKIDTFSQTHPTKQINWMPFISNSLKSSDPQINKSRIRFGGKRHYNARLHSSYTMTVWRNFNTKISKILQKVVKYTAQSEIITENQRSSKNSKTTCDRFKSTKHTAQHNITKPRSNITNKKT